MGRRKTRNISQKRKWLIPAIIAFLATIFAAIINLIPFLFSDNNLPEYYLVKGVSYHPDSILTIEAINSTAMKAKPINFEIDGFYYPTAAESKSETGKVIWQIPLMNLDLPDTVRRDGIHLVRFGFDREKLSLGQRIVFDSKEPQAFIGFANEGENNKRIFGQIIDNDFFDNQSISVEITFRNQERLQTIQLPVKSYVDEMTGSKGYEFEYRVQNIPKLSPKDKNYNQPFFSLNVKDKAGNEFHQESTYNAFIAEGVQKFGNKSAQVIMQRIGIEEVASPKYKVSSKQQSIRRKVKSGTSVITLRVLIRTSKYIKLSWNRLPDDLRVTTEEYIMMRNDQEIGLSFGTTYVDRSIDIDSTYRYQVLARDKNNIFHQSNISTVTPDSAQGWVYLGDYNFTKGKWDTLNFDFSPLTIPNDLIGKKIKLSKKIGWLNVREDMANPTSIFGVPIDVLESGTEVSIHEVKDWQSTGWMWARVSY
ncbi:MAG: hypothetical protein CV087_20230 [Candidatus Brocadia sp. WS118]|nr:MAG: hypothetical protein CV087_20230 [Candidatus Brocadia sp. WS118]